MKNLLIAIILSAGVSVDTPVPVVQPAKIDAGVVNQVQDGGYEYDVAKKAARRAAIVSSVKNMCADVSRATQTKVTLKSALFATSIVDDERDAAIFIIEDQTGLVGMFTMYRNGQWQTLPEDFR